MRYFSTFSGIGGFEVGIHNAFESTRLLQGVDQSSGATPDVARGLQSQPLCVGYSEINKYAIGVYQLHFSGVTNYGDITQINADELPDFECLVGGFPCQAFSVAGKRGGFADTRGTLFFDLARILQSKQPRLFVFENVKGLLSHDGGRTFATIIQTIDELGYDCQWQVLNSKDFGVPQNRERVIIVGHLRGTPRPEVFPIAGNSSQDIALGTLTARYAASLATGGYIRIKDAPETKVRRLTPLECERLQGFPDNWTILGYAKPGESTMLKIVSDTQRYKMCGNAVTTNVIQAVFERILA